MSTSRPVWPTVHTERRRLVRDLAGLSPEQWRTPSLCPGWDVHDVVAHLVDSARSGRLAFVRDLVRAGFDFDRANELGIARSRRPSPQETLADLEASAGLERTPPASPATRLVEGVVHGEDIRRPLGLTGDYPAEAVTRAIDYQVRTPVSFGGGRERVAGLRLVESGTGTAWGSGDDVVADGVDLLLAVSGRPIDADRLSGPGAPRLHGTAAA
ncbi:maleylpyruvate isomerase family mycothiol-dependent enzyme [Zhihengliuella alba]|uniref:Maleylpyruvate isomerase family mycothiol-dependent enzyme n=1 Tax=Zhihengliuella alba TaxID=547018 RepID=A0ABP7D273_9MICC